MMKNHKLLSALMVAVLCLAQGTALARPGKGRGNADNRHCDDARQGCEQEDRRQGPHGERDGGAGPTHSYYRGDRLPSDYRGTRYVVEDWRGHGLRTPPRGYHWVQTGGDYVLVAIATGVILELLLNH